MSSNRNLQVALILVLAVSLLSHFRSSQRLGMLEQQVSDLNLVVAEQEQSIQTVAQVAEAKPETNKQDLIVLADSRSQDTSAWRELTENELDLIVGGELGPGPGMTTALSAGSVGGALAPANLPPGIAEPAIQPEPESIAQRLSPRVERGGVLLRKGRTQIEPTVSYSHLSKNRVGLSGFSVFDVIFIGEIQAEEMDRDIVTSSLNVRHGLTDNLQVQVTLPSQLQREEKLSGPIETQVEEINYYKGLNDISTGLFYQFRREDQKWPGMIAHAKLKMPIGKAPRFGSGVWGLKGGLLFVKTSDPVVLFSNIGYTHTFSGEVLGNDINPGNSFEYNLGMAYALNYNLSANAGFEQVFVGKSTSNGSPINGSRLVVANLNAGLTYALSKNFSVDFSLGTGLTEDSPDFSASISFPYTF